MVISMPKLHRFIVFNKKTSVSLFFFLSSSSYHLCSLESNLCWSSCSNYRKSLPRHQHHHRHHFYCLHQRNHYHHQRSQRLFGVYWWERTMQQNKLVFSNSFVSNLVRPVYHWTNYLEGDGGNARYFTSRRDLILMLIFLIMMCVILLSWSLEFVFFFTRFVSVNLSKVSFARCEEFSLGPKSTPTSDLQLSSESNETSVTFFFWSKFFTDPKYK